MTEKPKSESDTDFSAATVKLSTGSTVNNRWQVHSDRHRFCFRLSFFIPFICFLRENSQL